MVGDLIPGRGKRVWVLRKPQRKEKYLSQFKVSVSAKGKINI